jgi:cysteine-rich repeat protein
MGRRAIRSSGVRARPRPWPLVVLGLAVVGMAGYFLGTRLAANEDAAEGGGGAVRVVEGEGGPWRGQAGRCGDGVVDPGEACDPAGDAPPCAWFLTGMGDGAGGGANGARVAECRADCSVDLGACTDGGGVCGDGTRDPGEQCDDGGTLSGDGCAADCVVEVGGRRVHSDGTLVDEQTRRSLQGSVCLDVAERRRVAALPSRRVEYRLRVCRLPSGEPVFPLGRARAAMEAASRELWAAGIELVEDSAAIEAVTTDCSVSFGDQRLRDLATESHEARTLPVFFVREVVGGARGVGWLGYGAFGFGAVVATADPQVVLHEVGHALGLSHTHACSGVPEGRGDCGATGDGLCDTPYDPGPAWWGQRCVGEEAQRCAPGCEEDECSGGAMPDRRNAMSYYTGCRGVLSGEQRDLARCVLEHELAWLQATDECGSERCNRRDDDCDGQVDEAGVCDEACEPARDLTLGETVGTTRGASDVFEAAEGMPEAPDRLFRFAPVEPGPYCVALTGGSGSGDEPVVLEQRDGCVWSATVISSNVQFGDEGVRVSRSLEVGGGEQGPIWLSVSGLRGAAGIDFRLVVSEGACGGAASSRTLRPPVLVAPLDRSHARERPIGSGGAPSMGRSPTRCG